MKLTDNIYLCGSGAYGLTPEGDCHCYVIDGGRELALIDCGLQRDPRSILAEMRKDGLDIKHLRYLLLTHAHPDHAGGCEWLQKNGVFVMAGKEEAAVLEHGLQNVLGLEKVPPGFESYMEMPRIAVDHILRDEEEIQIGKLKVKALYSPGHTAGSYSFLLDVPEGKQLFCGDQVFYHGFISLLAPPFSAYERYLYGLRKLSDRNISGLFPGHLLWTLRDGQKHIDKALWNMESGQRPELKPFS